MEGWVAVKVDSDALIAATDDSRGNNCIGQLIDACIRPGWVLHCSSGAIPIKREAVPAP